MTPALGKLIEIGGAPFIRGFKPVGDAVNHPGDIGASIREVLDRKNGFFCFEAALRFFPSTTVELSWVFQSGIRPTFGKVIIGGVADNIFCFAEEIFGRQFVVHDEKIAVFEPETGDLEIIASSLEEWASKMLLDYNQMTGHPLAHEWQSLHGPLHPRHRLMAKRPFVLGGEYSIENLVSLDSVASDEEPLAILLFSFMTCQDGTKIEFKIL
jgi:hypothetical protein